LGCGMLYRRVVEADPVTSHQHPDRLSRMSLNLNRSLDAGIQRARRLDIWAQQ